MDPELLAWPTFWTCDPTCIPQRLYYSLLSAHPLSAPLLLVMEWGIPSSMPIQTSRSHNIPRNRKLTPLPNLHFKLPQHIRRGVKTRLIKAKTVKD